jgi:hypothetical protein
MQMDKFAKKMGRLGAPQGDVGMVVVKEFPKDAVPTKNRVVADGEVTGHRHVVEGNVDMRETATDFYFMALEEGAKVTHQEHGTTELWPGQVVRVGKISQVEYDGELERRMAD